MTDPRELDCCNKWGGIGTSGLLCGVEKIRGVIWKDHTKEEHGEAVEDEDTVEGKLDCTGNGLAGVLGLSDSHTHKLSTKVGKGSSNERRPDSEEITGGTSGNVRLDSPRVFPVLETRSLATRTTATSKDQRNKNDTTNCDNFDSCLWEEIVRQAIEDMWGVGNILDSQNSNSPNSLIPK